MRNPATAGSGSPARIGREMIRAARDTRRRPASMPFRRGGEGPSVPNSTASQAASDRAACRQCRAVRRRPPAGHGYRASRHGDGHGRRAPREAAPFARSHGGTARWHAPARYDAGRDEDRNRRRRPVSAQSLAGSRSVDRGFRDGEPPDASPPARRCERAGRPSVQAGKEDRRWREPMEPGEQLSARRYQFPASRRPPGDRAPRCQAAERKPRPQWVHLRALGWRAMSTAGRRERSMARFALALAWCDVAPAPDHRARNAGLRRSHSQAKSRAVSNVRAR